MTEKKILITGASGFVGGHVARHLIGRGWQVVALGNRRSPDIAGATNGTVDLRDDDALAEILHGEAPSFVLHAAGITTVKECEADPVASEEINVRATAKLLEISHSLPHPPRVLFCSTDLVFDGEHAPYSEDDPPKPLHHYGSQKCAAEEVVLHHPNDVVARLPLMYGTAIGNARSFLSWMVDTVKDHRKLSLFHDEWRTPAWINDVARGMEIVLEKVPPGNHVYQFGGGRRLTREEIGRIACQAFGLDESLIFPCSRNDLPGGELRAMDVSLEPHKLTQLGWEPTPIAEAIKMTAATWPTHPPR